MNVCSLFTETIVDENYNGVLYGAGIITPTSVKFEIYPIERNKIQESPHNYIHHRLITEKFGYDSNSLFYKIITVRQILSYEETETKKEIYYYMPKHLTHSEIKELKRQIIELERIEGIYIGAVVYDIDPSRIDDEEIMSIICDPDCRTMYDNKNEYKKSIEEMIKILEENVVEEGYIIGIKRKNIDLGGDR